MDSGVGPCGPLASAATRGSTRGVALYASPRAGAGRGAGRPAGTGCQTLGTGPRHPPPPSTPTLPALSCVAGSWVLHSPLRTGVRTLSMGDSSPLSDCFLDTVVSSLSLPPDLR